MGECDREGGKRKGGKRKEGKRKEGQEEGGQGREAREGGGGVPIESCAELVPDLHETFAFITQTSDLQREGGREGGGGRGGEIEREGTVDSVVEERPKGGISDVNR